MNLLAGALLLLVVVGVAIAALYLLRRRAPAGGFYSDVDRAGALFGVVGTASGSIKPVDMTRTLEIMKPDPQASGGGVQVPCDEQGTELASR